MGWGVVVMGSLAATRADLSPLCLEACSVLMHTPYGRSPGFSSLSVRLSGLPTSQGGLSPLCRTPGLGCPVCGSACLLPRVGVHWCNLPFPLYPLAGAGPDLIAFLLFLPYYLCIFLTTLVVQESFCQFPAFSEGCSTCGCIFDVFVGDG